MKTLDEAFHHTLQDIYYAETALTKALPNVAKAAGNTEFKALVLTHLAETKQQIVILDKVFASIGQKAVGIKCDAIDGLIKETDGIINDATGIALDACLIAAAQAVEHYEIARYGALREWAVAQLFPCGPAPDSNRNQATATRAFAITRVRSAMP